MKTKQDLKNKLMHSLWIMALGICILNLAGCGSRSQGENHGDQSEEPKYLIFWSTPEKAGELAEQVGMKGDGKTRILGFGLPNSAFDAEDELPERIRNCFAAALEHDMAVVLHFGFHYFWKTRPDLWNWFDPDKPGYDPKNKLNVEWHDWEGPPNKVRYLNWGELERLPPHLAFTSEEVRSEVR